MFHRRFSRAQRNRILSNAICGIYFYTPDDPAGGAGGGAPKKEDPPAVTKIELTEDELKSKIDAALELERKKAATDRQKEKEEAERKKAEEQGEYQKVAETERGKREEAERSAAAAERRAQLAEVNISLRDHLAAKHPDYQANAADIMLHVERKLAADAKPDDVKKVIEAEAKGFVERTPRARVTPPPPAPSGRRNAGGSQQLANGENGNKRVGFTGAAARF